MILPQTDGHSFECDCGAVSTSAWNTFAEAVLALEEHQEIDHTHPEDIGCEGQIVPHAHWFTEGEDRCCVECGEVICPECNGILDYDCENSMFTHPKTVYCTLPLENWLTNG